MDIPEVPYAAGTPLVVDNDRTAPPARVCVGYNLVHLPFDDQDPEGMTMLVDMQGREIRRWKLMGEPALFLPGGSLIGGTRPHLQATAVESSVLRQLDWNGTTEWQYTGWDDAGTGQTMARQHHDLQREGNPVGYYAPGQNPLPNGRTLVLAHRDVTISTIHPLMLLDDVIYEVDFTGQQTGFIWQAADCFQDMGFDSRAMASIRQSSCLEADCQQVDWLHLNSMSELGRNPWYERTGDERFHPKNILISSREASFIAIISRRTGKLVWRVGPQFGPGQPEHHLGPLVGQHHAHMIPYGLPGAGNILIFDNGMESGYGGSNGSFLYYRDHSRVLEIDPTTLDVVWQYGHAVGPSRFHSRFLSSAQRLPNGNTLITASLDGRIFEVTPDGTIVWQLTLDEVGPGIKEAYRVYRVPPEWLPAGGNVAGYPSWKDGGC